MPALIQGRIVYPHAAIPDPQGRNPKANRPFVVISAPEQIKAGQDLRLIGITSNLQSAPEDELVRLPFGPSALTRFKIASAALCTWEITLPQTDVDVGDGLVRPKFLFDILAKTG